MRSDNHFRLACAEGSFRASLRSFLLRFAQMMVLVFVGAPCIGEETLTVFYRVEQDPRECPGTSYFSCRSAFGGTVQLVSFCGRLFFNDPVPRGSKVTRIDVRLGMYGHLATATMPPDMVLFSLNPNGSPERVIGSGVEPMYTNGSCFAGSDGPFQILVMAGSTFEEGIPFYNYGSENIALFRYSPGTPGAIPIVEGMELTFHYEPDAVVKFDLTDDVSERERRVLIHKYRTDDAYFSSAQQRLSVAGSDADGRIEIRGTVTSVDGAALANKKIYLRAGDPPDTASYVPEGDRLVGDNYDKAGGRFEVTNTEGQTVLVPTTNVVSDSSGRFKVVFRVSTNAAGDNYQIEASSVLGFDGKKECGKANNCYASGTLVAWKRVYAEVNRMFKRGAFLTETALPGSREISVSDVRPFGSPPFRVRLIHAPSIVGTSDEPFYSEEVTILRVTDLRRGPFGPQPGILHLDDVGAPGVGDTIESKYNEPESGLERERIYLADAVGVIGASTDATYHQTDRSLVAPLLAGAFVDVVWMVPDPVPAKGDLFLDAAIPFVERFQSTMTPSDSPLEWVTRKWIRSATRSGTERSSFPNHQSVFFGTRQFSAESLGQTTVLDGFNDAWLFLTIVSSAVAPEAFVHEMGHQWRLNQVWLVPDGEGTPGGHCDAAFGHTVNMSGRPLLCTMSGGNALYKSNPQARDGIVGFHYEGSGANADSEYLRIRRRAEPVPQREGMTRRELK